MKYENGKDVFPERLLRQIQKYVSGKLVYIPAPEEKKKNWGEDTGYRQYLQQRNHDMQLKFRNGVTIDQLAAEYSLSHETVKKIVYSKKKVYMMEYQCNLSSAMNYAANGKLEAWVHAYLLSDGHNTAFSDGLKQFDRYFLGPVKLPLDLFARSCGPEEGMQWRIPSEPFEAKVQTMMEAIGQDADLPPLILHYTADGFELNDGNHRYEAYRRLGFQAAYVIVWITEQEEYAAFMAEHRQFME